MPSVTSLETSRNGREKTFSQVVIDSYDCTVQKSHQSTTLTFEKARKMRLDPTLSLARDMAIAPILFATWAVEGDNEEAVEFLKTAVLPLRNYLMRTALYGEIDFGWKAYEVVYKVGELVAPMTGEKLGQRFYPRKIKPLLNDNTWQRRNKYGEYIGLLHEGIEQGSQIKIAKNYSLFINMDDEGLGNYGEPTLARAEAAFDAWNEVNEAANRYDAKISGAHWIVYYPEGKTQYLGNSSVGNADLHGKVDNSLIAQDILLALRSSGSISIPSSVSDMAEQLEDVSGGQWKIELLDSASKAADFVTRQKYLDALKARALGILERAIFEGQFGTKAEAEQHSNTTLLIQQLKHKDITDIINVSLVQFLLEVNYADPQGARLVAQPISDDRMSMFRALMEKMLSSPDTAAITLDAIDVDEVFNVLDIPRSSEGDQSIDDMLREAMDQAEATQAQTQAEATQDKEVKLSESDILTRFEAAAKSVADGDLTMAEIPGLGYSELEVEKLLSFAESISFQLNKEEAWGEGGDSEDEIKFHLKGTRFEHDESSHGRRKMTLSGEFWLQNGSSVFADGDIGVRNHEEVVVQRMMGELIEELERHDTLRGAADAIRPYTEYSDGVDLHAARESLLNWADQANKEGLSIDDIEEYILQETDFDAEALSVAFGSIDDARVYGVKTLGWDRVLGNEVQTWYVTRGKLEKLAEGLRDAYGEQVDNQAFNIEDSKSGKYYKQVPYSVLADGDMSELRGFSFSYDESISFHTPGGQQHDQKLHGNRKGVKGTSITDEQSFKEWFGDSKAVDENGEPLVLFHGTTSEFDVFENPFAEGLQGGWHMASTNSEYANQFAEGKGARVIPIFAKAKNPLDLRSLPASRGDVRNKLVDLLVENGFEDFRDSKVLPYERDLFQHINRASFRRVLVPAAEKLGFDSIIMPDNKRYVQDNKMETIEATTWILFDPKQIKSAIGNSGEFDPDNPDIRFHTPGGQQHDQKLHGNRKGVKGTSITDEQRKQNFKEWFGDSKVVDENGKPLVVYHGTINEFEVFKVDADPATWGGEQYSGGLKPIFFSDDPETASTYAYASVGSPHSRFDKGWEGARVIPTFLSIQKPLVLESHGKRYEGKHHGAIQKAFSTGSHDGVIIKDIIDGRSPGTKKQTSYIVFDSNQIKSAIGNSGEFDPDNPDIRFHTPGGQQHNQSKHGNRIGSISDDAFDELFDTGGTDREELRRRIEKVRAEHKVSKDPTTVGSLSDDIFDKLFDTGDADRAELKKRLEEVRREHAESKT